VRIVAVVFFACLFASRVAVAQRDFSALPLRIGDSVLITDPLGETIEGKVTARDDHALTVGGRTVAPSPGLRIDKIGDPVWDGAIKGALIGAIAGWLLFANECTVKWSWGRCIGTAAGWGAGLGLVIDWGHDAHKTIYIGTAGAHAADGQPPLHRDFR
jgi:hypothetical protein